MQAGSVGGGLLLATALWQRHRVTVGGDWREDFQLNVGNFDVNRPVTCVNAERDQFSFACYGQDELTILTNLRLSAGVRDDQL